MEGSQRKKAAQDRRLSIIDVSSADDSLLDPLSGNPDKQDSGHLSDNQEQAELLDTPNSRKFEDASSKLEEWEQEPRPSETFEMGKTKKNKCNLRKSLAWDSAFFTSAGVLDPEELSSIIEGVEKDEKHALPGIKEDLYMSCDSISTLESDSLTLESLEADLFEDIRASIQKSGKMSDAAYGKSKVSSGVAGFQTDDCKQPLPGIKEDVHRSCESISTLESDTLTPESMEANLFDDIRASIQKSSKTSDVQLDRNSPVPSRVVGLQTGDVLETTGMTSGNKLRASSSKNSSTTSVQLSGRMTKNHARPPVLQLSARRGEPSTVKQPKLPAKSTPGLTMSTKRASLGGLHAASERDKTKRVVGSVCTVPKAPTVRGPGGMVPKTTITSKSSSAPSVATKTKSTSTSSGRNLSGNTSKSPLNSLKRKVDAGAIKPPASGSAVRTPSKVGPRNKAESGNCSLSGSMSVTKLSSSISPASSVSDRSSESSSSTCMSKNRSNSSRTSIDSSSCRKVLSDTDTRQVSSSLNSPSDSSLEGRESQLIGSVGQCARSVSGGTALPSAPTRPSGLRMPSPKIGFFDGMKSSGRTPCGGKQSQSLVPRGLPHGSSVGPTEGQNKANLGKVQPARSNLSIKRAQPNNQQTSQPNPVHESLGVAVMTSSALQNAESSSEMSMEVPNKTVLESTAGNTSNMTEGHPVGMQELNLCLTRNIRIADEKPNKSDSSSTCDVENSAREIAGEGPKCGKVDKVEGSVLHEAMDTKEAVDSSMDKPSPEGANNMPSLNSIDNVRIVDEHNPSISSATEIDSLSFQLGGMDINSKMQKKFDSHSLSCSLSDVNSQDDLNVIELPSRKEHVDCPKVEESFNDLNSLGPCSPARTRRPFAVKDSFCNMDGLFRVSTDSSVAEVKSNLSLPQTQSMSKEN
ncbi:mucin-5AC isoform X2 [Neltuma alba]|uniref:mucin-5AC isoform X2 n=1 Tax=Neltuma alba TaxID=207710 RepID=UPI0010A318F5|nr:mucin-5AC isoform X2 [Prosopis alba]